MTLPIKIAIIRQKYVPYGGARVAPKTVTICAAPRGLACVRDKTIDRLEKVCATWRPNLVPFGAKF